jgi:tyrosinase
MAEVRIRRDIWGLEDEAGGPWHPVVDAYARAVGVMKARAAGDPTSWAFQAAIHGRRGGDWRQQCQHFCWYFLPWHRLYLRWFEAIVRAAVADLDGVDYDVKESWALPYWNYGRGEDFARLPTAFREEKLADGTTDNPLYEPRRNGYVLAGDPMPAEAVEALPALSRLLFSEPFVGGFGGAATGRNHTNQAAGAVMGGLEGTPHGSVHVEVGGRTGFMSAFDTAGLDAIFWLHHCNIDRLWEVWRTQDGTADPTDARWTGESFEFHDANGSLVSGTAADVLDTEGQLGYSYEDVSLPPMRVDARTALRKITTRTAEL